MVTRRRIMFRAFLRPIKTGCGPIKWIEVPGAVRWWPALGARPHGATVRLEHLWNEFLQTNALSPFRAYPKCGMTEDVAVSLHEICAANSKTVPG